MPTAAGVNAKTPQKKPSVGQKKPLEALGSPPPSSRLNKSLCCMIAWNDYQV